MRPLVTAGAALRKVGAYLREVSGEAAFERQCAAHAAKPLSTAARRALWREHTRRTVRETARCC